MSTPAPTFGPGTLVRARLPLELGAPQALLTSLRAQLVFQIEEHHGCAFASKQTGRRSSNASRSACDQALLSMQPTVIHLVCVPPMSIAIDRCRFGAAPPRG